MNRIQVSQNIQCPLKQDIGPKFFLQKGFNKILIKNLPNFLKRFKLIAKKN